MADVRSSLGMLALLFLVSCTTTIRAPANPEHPRPVALITHGLSSSLVLASDEGGHHRWAFGDWRYYALGRKGLLETIAALFWPTDSALGRQRVELSQLLPHELMRRLGIGIDRIFIIVVSGEAIAALDHRLGEMFVTSSGSLHQNPDAMLEFVRRSEPYSLVNNSNGKVAEWLRELGCRVSGFPLLSRWRVVEAVAEPDRSRSKATREHPGSHGKVAPTARP